MEEVEEVKGVNLICCACGKKFEYLESQIKYNLGKRHFCSKSCFQEWLPNSHRERSPHYLTHNQLVDRTTEYFASHNWKKLSNLEARRTLGFTPSFIPDGFYYNDNNNYMIVIEAKPEYNDRGEIFRGIGQCLCVMLFQNIKPYLIMHEKNLTMLKPFYDKYLWWLGIIMFDSSGNMILEKKCNIDTIDNNLKLDPYKIKQTVRIANKIQSQEEKFEQRNINHNRHIKRLIMKVVSIQ